MKKILFIFIMAMTLASQAFAFNPDPTKFEYIGQKASDEVYYFYEIASAKADGQKGVIVALQADPKNRTLRFYRNTVIDPATMTIRSTYCELCDYQGNVLETFNLPSEGVQYQSGDLTDKIYQDLRAKGIVPPPPPPPIIRPKKPIGWEIGLPGGEEKPAEDIPIPTFSTSDSGSVPIPVF